MSSNTRSIVVIVVEDEPLIRMVAVEDLIDDGLEVLEAQHAAEALGHLAVNADRVHAIFTDIHMPGAMDGVKLAQHARLHWPWIELLITSARPHPGANLLPERSRFISKPYETQHVIWHLRDMTAVARA